MLLSMFMPGIPDPVEANMFSGMKLLVTRK